MKTIKSWIAPVLIASALLGLGGIAHAQDLSDLRVDPNAGVDRAEASREPPQPANRDFQVPSYEIDDDSRIRPDWNGGPVIRYDRDF